VERRIEEAGSTTPELVTIFKLCIWQQHYWQGLLGDISINEAGSYKTTLEVRAKHLRDATRYIKRRVHKAKRYHCPKAETKTQKKWSLIMGPGGEKGLTFRLN